MKVAGMEADLPLVWQYVEDKIAPFVCELFSGVKDSSSVCPTACSTLSPQQSVWDILLNLKEPLSKMEVPDN